MNTNAGNTVKGFLIIAIVLAVVDICLLTSVDRSSYKTSDFYATTMERLDSIKEVLDVHIDGPLQAGWGVANITPAHAVRLTGKNWTPYKQVYDSIYVRILLFSNGMKSIALVSYDLWFIHPHLAKEVRERISKANLGITGIYFTANHSHTSIGGWASGILGCLVVGGNSRETVDFLGSKTIEALRSAQQGMLPAKAGYGEIATSGLVKNRLNSYGILDNKLRVLKIRNNKRQLAVLNTYSAHSVFMDKDINTLSADYSGPFLGQVLAPDSIHFASFASGATGSHTPEGRKPFERKKMKSYGAQLAGYFHKLQSRIRTDSVRTLKFIEWPVNLRSPHFRVTNNLRVRPWFFEQMMGKANASITALRIGNTVLIGLPVELSGEFYPQFEALCQQRGLHLMITSFNGNYLGYVNPSKYYDSLRTSETREMNWYGPESGEYFVELVNRLIAII